MNVFGGTQVGCRELDLHLGAPLRIIELNQGAVGDPRVQFGVTEHPLQSTRTGFIGQPTLGFVPMQAFDMLDEEIHGPACGHAVGGENVLDR